jgi:hypothetical protein
MWLSPFFFYSSFSSSPKHALVKTTNPLPFQQDLNHFLRKRRLEVGAMSGAKALRMKRELQLLETDPPYGKVARKKLQLATKNDQVV